MQKIAILAEIEFVHLRKSLNRSLEGLQYFMESPRTYILLKQES